MVLPLVLTAARLALPKVIGWVAGNATKVAVASTVADVAMSAAGDAISDGAKDSMISGLMDNVLGENSGMIGAGLSMVAGSMFSENSSSTALPLVMTLSVIAAGVYAAYNHSEFVEKLVDNALDSIGVGDVHVGTGAVKEFFETEAGQKELTNVLGDDGKMSLNEAEGCLKRHSELSDITPEKLMADVNQYAEKIGDGIDEHKTQYADRMGGEAKNLVADMGISSLAEIGENLSQAVPNMQSETAEISK